MNINVLQEKDLASARKSIKVVLLFENRYTDTVVDISKFSIEKKYGKLDLVRYYENYEQKILAVGLGSEEDLSKDKIRTIGANISRELNNLNASDAMIINIDKLGLSKEYVRVLVEGLVLGLYKFDKYKTSKYTSQIENIDLVIDSSYLEEIEEGKLIAECNIIARNLTNEPSNFMTPKNLSIETENLGKKYGFDVQIYSEEEIKELKMDAFLEVAKGSNESPKLIVMRYNGDNDSDKILGLVGKGLTYDSGGFSLKSTESMVNMNTDMGGASSVIGAMCAIAKKKIKKNVVAVVAACENIISSKAYKPGDIISSMSGKTIEVLNTDCEGRLTLADAVYYIVNKEKVNKVVTIATLTGASVTALGNITTPVISNDDVFFDDLYQSSKLAGEKIWRMPHFEEYRNLIIGDTADLKNLAGKHGGCITGALFVGEFTCGVPWVHLDIAGTVTSKEDKGYRSKGASGEGAKTLYYLANQ